MTTVLVTRPLAEALETAARLRALGHAAMIEPMLTIRPLETPLPAGAFDAVVVTSGNAVAALAGRAGLAPLLPLPLLAVGKRTATAAREAGFAGAHMAGRDVESLLAHVAQRWTAPQRLLYLAGSDRASDLAAALAPLGHGVETATLYEARQAERMADATAEALLAGTIGAVLHYSARTAQAFLACCRGVLALGEAPVRHLCLSEKVAGVLREAGARHVLVAERPDEEALLARLAG